MSILPSFMLSQVKKRTEIAQVIEIPREYAIDFSTGQMTGKVVEGAEAIRVWVWLCLKTQRFRYPIYSWDYGADVEQYIGKALTDEYLEVVLKNEIEDALKVNRYITGISEYTFVRQGEKVEIRFTINTTLGEAIQEEYDVRL